MNEWNKNDVLNAQTSAALIKVIGVASWSDVIKEIGDELYAERHAHLLNKLLNEEESMTKIIKMYKKTNKIFGINRVAKYPLGVIKDALIEVGIYSKIDNGKYIFDEMVKGKMVYELAAELRVSSNTIKQYYRSYINKNGELYNLTDKELKKANEIYKTKAYDGQDEISKLRLEIKELRELVNKLAK